MGGPGREKPKSPSFRGPRRGPLGSSASSVLASLEQLENINATKSKASSGGYNGFDATQRAERKALPNLLPPLQSSMPKLNSADLHNLQMKALSAITPLKATKDLSAQSPFEEVKAVNCSENSVMKNLKP